MFYSARTVFFLICLTVLFASFVGAQEKQADLKSNKPLTFSLAPGEKKSFALQMRKLDFAELSWIANDSVSLSISLYNPKNEDFYNQIAFEDDSVSFIAPETGEYTIDFEIRNSSEIKEPQNITLEYKNVFKQPPGSVVKATRQVNGYIVKILLSPQTKSQYGKSIVLFEKGGQLQNILKSGGDDIQGFFFGDDIAHTYSPADKRSVALVKSTPDKTGEGTPDIMIKHYSGGAHCCGTALFFELGESIRAIEPIITANSDIVAIGKNPKGGLRFETSDDTFAYWQVCFACSPMQTVILEFKNGSFRPNFELMRKPAPSLTFLKNKAREAAANLGSEPYRGIEDTESGFESAFWDVMLDLIYTGHEDLAWQYLDLVWSPQKQGKAIFRKDFQNQLNESRYWKKIQEDTKAK